MADAPELEELLPPAPELEEPLLLEELPLAPELEELLLLLLEELPPLLELEELEELEELLLLAVELGVGSLDPHPTSRLVAASTQATPCSLIRSLLNFISHPSMLEIHGTTRRNSKCRFEGRL